MSAEKALVASASRNPVVTDEMRRILRAVAEDRLIVNSAGRYVIEGELRPDRRSRELLRGRHLIEHRYEMGRGSYWRITAKGKAALLRDPAEQEPPGSSFGVAPEPTQEDS